MLRFLVSGQCKGESYVTTIELSTIPDFFSFSKFKMVINNSLIKNLKNKTLELEKLQPMVEILLFSS